jgi:CHAT domain-containing protein/Tfp pilus assembly protein PilF
MKMYSHSSITVVVLGAAVLASGQTRPVTRETGTKAVEQPNIPTLPLEVRERVDRLTAQIEGLQKVGKYSEAVPVAEMVASLMKQNLPDGWWEVGDARHQADDLRWIARQPPEVRDAVREAEGLNAKGEAAYEAGEYVKAEALFRRALEVRRKVLPAGHRLTAASLNNLATPLQAQNRLAEAEPLLREALEIDRKGLPKGHPDIAFDLTNLAGLLQDENDLVQAEPLYREALDVRRKSLPAQHPDIATSLNNLANFLKDENKLVEAEPLFREALAIRRASLSSGHPDLATTLNSLAVLLKDQNKLAEAEPLYQEALSIRRRALPAMHPDIATSLNNLAALLRARRRPTEAEPLYREALNIDRHALPAGHPDIISDINNYAGLLEEQGKLVEAEALFREALNGRRHALPAAHPDIASSLNNLAVLLRSQSKLAEAEPLFREALGIWRKILPASHPYIANGLNSLASLLRDQGRFAEAEPLFQEALKINEAQRSNLSGDESARASYASKLGMRAFGLSYASVLCSLSRTSEAVDVTERVTGRALLDLLTRSDRDLVAEAGITGDLQRAAILRKRLGDEQAAKIALSNSESRLAHGVHTKSSDLPALQTELKTAQQVLRTAEAAVLLELQGSFPVAKPLGSSEISAQLPQGVLAVTFGWSNAGWSGDVVLATWASASGSDAVVLAEKKEPVTKLSTLAQQVRSAVLSPDQADWQTPARELSGLLFVPKIREAIAKVDTLVVVPDGPLAELPLVVLAAADPRGPLAGKKIVYAPSMTAYIDRLGKAGKASGATSALVIGGAIYERGSPSPRPTASLASIDTRGPEAAAADISAVDQVRLFGGKLSPLPGTTTEAQAVAASLTAKGMNPVVLLGEDATAPKLREKLVGARYVHLATHGLMGTSDRPYDASLALTQPVQATPEDIGFLRLDDLIAKFAGRLDGCEMVVLSACDTGRGQQKGDTILSLPMGFFFAGTPTVVASLWRVDDNATSLMMARFYDNLLGNYTSDRPAYGRAYKAGTPMTKIDALQEARDWLRGLSQPEADKALSGLGKGGNSTINRGGVEDLGTVTPNAAAVHPYDHPRFWAPFILIGAEK